MTLRSRVRSLWRWLVLDPWPVWAGVLAPSAVFSLSALFTHDREFRVRIAGFLVTLIGVLLVAKGIVETRKLFKRPPVRERVKAWWGRLPEALAGGRTVDAQVSIAAAGAAGDAEAEVITVASDATLESRVAALEQRAGDLSRRITTVKLALRGEIRDVRASIETERSERARDTRAVSDRLESYSAGGLDQEGVGAFWVLVGQAFGSFPEEIAEHVPPWVPFW